MWFDRLEADQQVMVHQRTDPVLHLDSQTSVGDGDPSRGLQCATDLKDGQPPEQFLLAGAWPASVRSPLAYRHVITSNAERAAALARGSKETTLADAIAWVRSGLRRWVGLRCEDTGAQRE